MKRLMVFAALGVAAVGLLAAFGWGPPHRGPRDPAKMEKFLNWRLNETLDDLKATPEQRAKVLAVKDRLLPEARAMMAERQGMHEELEQVWGSANPDRQAVKALIDQRIEKMRAFSYKLADGLVDVHQALTPEQRAQLAKEMEEHHRSMGGRGHGHGGPRP